MIKIKRLVSISNNNLFNIKLNILNGLNTLKPIIYNVLLKTAICFNKFKTAFSTILKTKDVCFNKSLIEFIVFFVIILRILNREIFFIFLLIREPKFRKYAEKIFLKYCE